MHTYPLGEWLLSKGSEKNSKRTSRRTPKVRRDISFYEMVFHGASHTLEQIGYIDVLKTGKHPWKNIHEEILQEKYPDKQMVLRKQSVISDYYLGSVHALVENGEFIVASNTGSKLPHIVYTSKHLVFAVSKKKIVSTMEDAMARLTKHVVPMENERMLEKYGVGTSLNKIVLFFE